IATGKQMEVSFNPLALSVEERRNYRYECPEIIYVFWVKHGPCMVTGCGHRTPIMSSPIVAVKSLTVKVWEGKHCEKCHKSFDVEEREARLAPGVPVVIAESEKPFAGLDRKGGVRCPHCEHWRLIPLDLKKRKNKRIDFTLLVHPTFLAGAPNKAKDGEPFGGSATDTPESTAAWNA